MRSPSSLILAIDTSTRSVGLALYDGESVLSSAVWVSQDHHTVELAPAAAELLGKSGVKFSDLGALTVALGPGSFTGLRIGLALAKGIALARRLPVVGIPSLDILAAAQPVKTTRLAAVLKAGRGRLAVGWYQGAGEDGQLLPAWRSLEHVESLTPAELSAQIQTPTQVCGELDEDERRLLARKRKNIWLASPAASLRSPAYLAELGWQRWQAGQVDDPAALAPIYLHYNNPVPG